MTNKKRAFELLKQLSFERIGGSSEEKRAAQIIKNICEENAVEVEIEEFEVDCPTILKAKMEVLEPEYKEYTVTGYGMSGNTPEEGVTGDFVYIEGGLDLNLLDVEGKVVLLHEGMRYETYKKLIEKKVAAFISLSGSLYDEYDKTDLDERLLRDRHYQNGKIPGVTMRMRDGHDLILSKPKTVRITLEQDETQKTSCNVVATIPGTVKPSEIIAFTAHFDSVRFSTGAYDNATGSITIMELMHYFIENKPQRTLKFIWCGSEEKGLLGSKEYTKKHETKLEDYKFCINVDMNSPVIGYDIAVCTSENSLVNYIDYLSKEKGFPIKVSQGVYSSDSTPFADKGIPAVSFARIAPAGGAVIHSRKDIIDFLDSDNFEKSVNFIIDFSSRVINSVMVPVPKTIPQNMKDELDKYLGRKEK